MTNSFLEFMETSVKLVDQKIAELLPKGGDRISEAMRYSASSQGKRLRPILLISTANIFGVNPEHSLRAAAAVEIVHSYSLIHDDLPAMDNDDFRRGMPSCHKKFDEATAILAGDALLTLAFEILSASKTHSDAKIRCELVQILAKNIGFAGMAGGQMFDLLYERHVAADYSQLIEMQNMKTAKLFVACCEMGAALGNASEKERQHLVEYGKNFGLAFQFADDLEDLKEGKELNNNNIVKFLGEQQTKSAVQQFVSNALRELEIFADKAKVLDKIASQLLGV
jgi:farnesyl diphosphate synthase